MVNIWLKVFDQKALVDGMENDKRANRRTRNKRERIVDNIVRRIALQTQFSFLPFVGRSRQEGNVRTIILLRRLDRPSVLCSSFFSLERDNARPCARYGSTNCANQPTVCSAFGVFSASRGNQLSFLPRPVR